MSCQCLFQHPTSQAERERLKARLEVVKIAARAARRGGDHQHPSLTEAAVLYVRLYTPCGELTPK